LGVLPLTRCLPPRPPYSGYGDKDPRPRSRSPVYGRDGRDGREPRDSRDGRDSLREPRPGGHSRDHDYRYRSSEGRDKDPRARLQVGCTRMMLMLRILCRLHLKPLPSSTAGDRARPEERRRNELYRQYYEELQRATTPTVPSTGVCETVGRKVRDLGMVVDLIFLNTEVSLTQALEDVGRARTPFAIIITQQHQVHRSCTVNILFGTPQEHRNMPMQDAMMLVAHNYDAYKVENREKEREEIARKAAKMADDVLLREPDRESHPVSVLTAVTLLSENRFLTPEELDGLIAYLKDKRARLARSAGDSLSGNSALNAGSRGSARRHPSRRGALSSRIPTSLSSHTVSQSSHLAISRSCRPKSSVCSTTAPARWRAPEERPAATPSLLQRPGRGDRPEPGPPGHDRPPAAAAQGYGSPPGRLPAQPAVQRAAPPSSGINFDNPSVQKALDTLIQSGPSLNHLVNAAAPPQQQHTPSSYKCTCTHTTPPQN
uniref:Nuclear receptor coactivator 5 n=1 Tax=Salarias fasciatus TaxID=181472 RepID=A0A672FFT1_SALFA